MSRLRLPVCSLLLALAAPAAAALHPALLEPAYRPGVGFPASVAGTVNDLSLDGAGRLLFCTEEGDVGHVNPADGVVTVLATAITGPFSVPLTAVLENPAGDVAVLDDAGDIYTLPGGLTPAVLVYDDLYMVGRTTDMIVDASGNYILASATPSDMKEGINWISSDGQRWGYYLVRHAGELFRPIQLAADPLNDFLLVADEELGGALQCVDTFDPVRPLCALDTAALFGHTAANEDGDMAAEASGDVLIVSGGTLYRWERTSGSSFVVASGFGQLRGLAIAASSGCVPSASGWSAYVAEGSGTTTIHEIPDVGAPAPLVIPSLGSVPDRGIYRTFFGSIRVYEVETDLDGNLLIGGDKWGANKSVHRIELPSLTMTKIADENDGILGRIEGIVQKADGTIFAMDSSGIIYEIHENPTSVSIYYDDAAGQITAGKDLALERDGTLFVADREAWGAGEVREILPGGASNHIVATEETRALTVDGSGPGFWLTEWVDTGFFSKITQYDFSTDTKLDAPGFFGFNLTNASSWGDGDSVVDVEGYVYVVSEDDWSLARWKPGQSGIERIGSSYLNHPSGLAIAPSMATSTTGWSLYVTEYDFLHEIPDVAAPAPEILDRGGPPIGNLYGYMSPTIGRPQDLIPDPGGNGLLIPAAGGMLMRMGTDGAVTTLAGAPEGLAGDLRGAVVRSDGHVLVASAEGVVYDLDPLAGWSASVLFDDAADELEDVRGMTIDGLDRLILVDRPAGRPTSKLLRLDAGALELLSFTNRGVRAAVDPLTADIFVTQEGHAFENGEVLRVDALASPAAIGAWKEGDLYEQFAVGESDGGIAFDDAGNFYIVEGESGRVVFVERTTGARTDVSGNYANPSCVTLAPGSPGVAGTSGTSLFVLDGCVIYEIGVEGLPAGAPPATNPGLAASADIRMQGLATPGGSISVTVENPDEAGKVYVIFASYAGHLPGLPLSLLGDPTDERIIANNADFLWDNLLVTSLFPGFVASLDPLGMSQPGTGINIPNIPVLMNDTYIDMTWVVVQAGAQNYMSYVGGTTHLFMGE